ncbi:MAG: DUF1508 domain-containing protein [Clostridiaceae bacterium]|nr:DUF1508 domain-containing protein [Clostridiaceae bacterium]
MIRAAFEIKKNAVGRYYFIFKDDMNEAIVVSGSFGSRSDLEKNIACIRETAAVADLCEIGENLISPLFKLCENKDGFTFSLLGYEGETILTSKLYHEKSRCVVAVNKLKRLSYDANIIDFV